MGLFAMPVIYSERDWHQVVGESYYIQLGPQDRCRLDGAGRQSLRNRPGQSRSPEGRDLSRCYLMVHGRRNESATWGSPAASKQRITALRRSPYGTC